MVFVCIFFKIKILYRQLNHYVVSYYRSCGKVMFLRLSVILFTGGSVRGEGGCAWQGVCVVGGHVWQGGQEGVHAGEMATEAGGTRPPGMYCCCKLISCNNTAFQ